MVIKTLNSSAAKEHEVTDEALFWRRREIIRAGLAGAAIACVPSVLRAKPLDDLRALPNIKKTAYDPKEDVNSYSDITKYNNFYEFGFEKNDPARLAWKMKTDPWTVEIAGEVAKPGKIAFEDLIKPHALEERIYRLRCVEAWSLVVPWVGIPLAAILKRFEPTSKAKYVAFETLYDPKQMPEQSSRSLDWPYREGLRIDEAMHPLTLIAVGIYGKELPGQNGAPLRLVVPWKYGFKSIKSIVKITLTDKQPLTTWNQRAPREYGFYANVNPTVNHPRWSQAKERRIGEFFRRETLMFNGYDEVSSLYAGMNLTQNY